ncbi:HIT family protein [Sulfolobus tengchongensis]|uniref:HIT family protein n=1 Tax=Sulfolobus tengchongensis TaxID=207809 RepID=A0AAX4L5N3_9CREN
MCVFCNIIEGKDKGYIVYNDDKVVAFLDKFPITPGHTLVVPRLHYENFLEIPNDNLPYLCNAVKRVAIAVKRALNADGIRILTNIGRSAGQVVFHSHFHIVPTWSQDPDIIKDFVPRKEQSKEYYEYVQRAIIESLKNI